MSAARLRWANLRYFTPLVIGALIFFAEWGWVAKLSSTNQAIHASYSGMMQGLLGAMMGLLLVTMGVLQVGLMLTTGPAGHVKALEGRLDRLDSEVAALRRTESS